MLDLPLISVITPVWNGSAYLVPLIESVLQQDYPHYEHIIIDDGSADEGATVAILQRFRHLRWWSHENKGQYETQNDGLRAAKGDIVVIISADDVFSAPDTFSRVVRLWQKKPDLSIIYGRTARMTKAGNHLPDYDSTWRYPRWLIKSYLFVQHCSLYVRRDLITSNELWFDGSLHYRGDWDWIVRVWKASSRIGYVNVPLSIVRTNDASMSGTANRELAFRESQTVLERYGGNRFVFLWCHRIVRWRAMAILGWVTLKTDGATALWARIRRSRLVGVRN